MIVTYKGQTIELGELPGPRKAYWKNLSDDVVHEVECGSWEDLEKIARRAIDYDQTQRLQEQEG